MIVDPQVVQVAYPGRDGAFGLSLPAGEYVLKAFFAGQAGRQTGAGQRQGKVDGRAEGSLNVAAATEGTDSK